MDTTTQPDSLFRSRARFTPEERLARLTSDVKAAVAQKTACQIVGHSHTILTRFLRNQWLANQPQHQINGVCRFAYGDGSIGEELSLAYLGDLAANTALKGEFNLGTLSARHLNYDAEIDRYLLRHAETLGLNNTAVEKMAFKKMEEFLKEFSYANIGALRILQAGLEPLAVGMYRALRNYLQQAAASTTRTFRIYTHFDLSRDPIKWI